LSNYLEKTLETLEFQILQSPDVGRFVVQGLHRRAHRDQSFKIPLGFPAGFSGKQKPDSKYILPAIAPFQG
jgi:hypothetical protein